MPECPRGVWWKLQAGPDEHRGALGGGGSDRGDGLPGGGEPACGRPSKIAASRDLVVSIPVAVPGLDTLEESSS